MSNAKMIVFRYDGDSRSEETEYDHNGEMPFYQADQIVFSKGKRWRVVAVIKDTTGPKALPVHRVFLEESPEFERL